MPSKVERQVLEAELKRLVDRYGRGQELDIEWKPQDLTRYYASMGRKLTLNGEVDVQNKVIKIYTANLQEALDVVDHEFFEYIFDKLVSPADILFNEVTEGFQRAFNRIRYEDKETFIKLLVKMERRTRNNAK